MFKEIRETKANGILQITLPGERWYIRDDKERPSSTWKSSCWPKSQPYYKWLAETGWDEAQALKKAGGIRGTVTHRAIDEMVSGATIDFNSKVLDPETERERDYTIDEITCIISASDWWKKANPLVLAHEFVVLSDKYNFGGTVDLLCLINGELWIIDYKTSASIWKEYELQISSYKHGVIEMWPELYPLIVALHGEDLARTLDPNRVRLGILQLGYNRNQQGWKFNEVEDQIRLFVLAGEIWAEQNPNAKVKQLNFPVTVSLY